MFGGRWCSVSRASYLAYIVAAMQFVRDGRSTAAVLSLILLSWLVVVDAFVARSVVPDSAEQVDGWTAGAPLESADFLAGMRSFTFVATLMSYSLMLFGPLLAVWSFLL